MPETIAADPPLRRQEWRLPSHASSVRSVRSGLRAFVHGTPMTPDVIDDLLLAACEAATNAIEHAQRSTQPDFELVIEEHQGLVVVVVRDHGRWRDGPVGPHRGRGLVLMTALTDVTIRTNQHGTTVTICIPVSSNGQGDERT